MAKNVEKKGISNKKEIITTRPKKPAGTKKSFFSFDFMSLTFIHSKSEKYITPAQKRNSNTMNARSIIIPLHM